MHVDPATKLRPFFIARAVSTFGDEIWIVALPLYFATKNYSLRDLGFYSSISAIGTVVGFAFLPLLSRNWRASSIAIAADLVQLLIFAMIFSGLLIFRDFPIGIWLMLGFAVSLAEAAWFGSSESIVAKLTDKSSVQNAHRWNYLSANFGPLLAPLCAVTLTAKLGLTILAAVNCVTFTSQIGTLIPIRNAEVQPPSNASSLSLKLMDLLKNPIYRPMLLITNSVKLLVVGILPFIPYTLARMPGVASITVALIVAAFPCGSLFGSVSYREKAIADIGRKFFFDVLGTLACFILLLLGVYFQATELMVVAAIACGFFSARYTIELRTIRQLVTRVALMPKLISLQGMLSRAVTPLAGLLFAAILNSNSVYWSLLVSGLGLLICSYASWRISRELPIALADVVFTSRA